MHAATTTQVSNLMREVDDFQRERGAKSVHTGTLSTGKRIGGQTSQNPVETLWHQSGSRGLPIGKSARCATLLLLTWIHQNSDQTKCQTPSDHCWRSCCQRDPPLSHENLPPSSPPGEGLPRTQRCFARPKPLETAPAGCTEQGP